MLLLETSPLIGGLTDLAIDVSYTTQFVMGYH